jgi:hypothetical protein
VLNISITHWHKWTNVSACLREWRELLLRQFLYTFVTLFESSKMKWRWTSALQKLSESHSIQLNWIWFGLRTHSLRVHLDLDTLRLVAVRLPMPLHMQLCLPLDPCLFLMHAHASSYLHQDRSTHALFGLQSTMVDGNLSDTFLYCM